MLCSHFLNIAETALSLTRPRFWGRVVSPFPAHGIFALDWMLHLLTFWGLEKFSVSIRSHPAASLQVWSASLWCLLAFLVNPSTCFMTSFCSVTVSLSPVLMSWTLSPEQFLVCVIVNAQSTLLALHSLVSGHHLHTEIQFSCSCTVQQL